MKRKTFLYSDLRPGVGVHIWYSRESEITTEDIEWLQELLTVAKRSVGRAEEKEPSHE